MIATRLLLLAAFAAGVASQSAKAETIDHISVTATPATYEGPCPVSIKLESLIRFDVIYNREEKYLYRWESNDEALTEYVTTFSKGRNNHVEGSAELQGPAGKSVTIPIRLHTIWGATFGKMDAWHGKSVNDHYSVPFNVTLTCR